MDTSLENELFDKIKVRLPLYLLHINPMHMHTFERLAEGEGLRYDEVEGELLWKLSQLGLLQVQKYQFKMAAEVQEAYKLFKMDEELKEDVMNKQAYFGKINAYKKSCLHLYGAISIDDLLSLYRGFEGEVDERLVRRWLKDDNDIDGESFIEKDIILDEYFSNMAPEKKVYFFSEIKKRPYYLPDKEKFLQYADRHYYEETDATCALRACLNKHYKGKEKEVEGILSELAFFKRMEIGEDVGLLEKLLADFRCAGIMLEKSVNLDEEIACCKEVLSATRRWIYNGHR